MIKILKSAAVPNELLVELRGWFEAQWGEIDSFTGNNPDCPIPPPLVAIDDRSTLLGGLAFGNALIPQTTDVAVWVNAVLVKPDQRGKGIASKLIQAAEAEAQHMGITKLFVLSEVPSLYQKQNWSFESIDESRNGTVLSKTFEPM